MKVVFIAFLGWLVGNFSIIIFSVIGYKVTQYTRQKRFERQSKKFFRNFK